MEQVIYFNKERCRDRADYFLIKLSQGLLLWTFGWCDFLGSFVDKRGLNLIKKKKEIYW